MPCRTKARQTTNNSKRQNDWPMKTCIVCNKWEIMHTEAEKEACLKIKLDGTNLE